MKVIDTVFKSVDIEHMSKMKLAAFFGHKSTTTITRWTKDGCPRNKDPKKTYCLPLVIAWRIKRADDLGKKNLEELRDASGTSVIQNRLLEAKTQSAELALAEELKLFCSREESEHQWGVALGTLSARLQGLPNKLSARLDGKDFHEREQIIGDELKYCIQESKKDFKKALED